MQNDITILKGIHPGIILEKELKKRKLSKRKFALSIGEFPQTIGAIIKGKRDMNIPLSLKLEKALSLDEGFLMTLQVYFTIKKLKNDQEKSEIKRFYGEQTIREIMLANSDNNFNYI